MKINFPRVYAQISLADYAPGFEGEIVTWVNPPRSLIMQFVEAIRAGEDVAEYLAQVWRDWSVMEIVELREQANDTDPALYPWLMARTFDAIGAHREGIKKNRS